MQKHPHITVLRRRLLSAALLVAFAGPGCKQQAPTATAPEQPEQALASTPAAALRQVPLQAAAPLDVTAADASKLVLGLVRAMGDTKVKVTEATRQGPLFRIGYASTEDKGGKRTVWVTGDGRYVTTHLVDIDTRTEQLRRDRRYAACMVARGLQIFIDPADKNSEAMIAALGAFPERVVVDCGGTRTALCAALGHENLPVIKWDKGAEIGYRDRKWLNATTGCRSEPFAEVAAPPTVDPTQLAARVRELHATASRDPVDVGGVWRQGQVWHVALVRRGEPPENLRVTTSADGRWLMEDPIDIEAERLRVIGERRFVDCLAAAKARLYVSSRQPASMRWLGKLGPTAVQLAIDCVNEAGSALCKEASIDKVPTVVAGGRRLTPPFQRRDLEALTGCK